MKKYLMAASASALFVTAGIAPAMAGALNSAPAAADQSTSASAGGALQYEEGCILMPGNILYCPDGKKKV